MIPKFSWCLLLPQLLPLPPCVGRIAGLARPAWALSLLLYRFSVTSWRRGHFGRWQSQLSLLLRRLLLRPSSLVVSRTPCIESSMIAKILMDGLDYSSASAKAKYCVERAPLDSSLEHRKEEFWNLHAACRLQTVLPGLCSRGQRMLAKIVGRWSLEQLGTAVITAPKTQQTRQLPLATKLAKNLIITWLSSLKGCIPPSNKSICESLPTLYAYLASFIHEYVLPSPE